MNIIKKYKYLVPFIGIFVLRKRTPLFVTWDLTWRCNYNCEYCNLTNIEKQELSISQIFQLIDQMREAGVKLISFNGGEVLLREDIIEIIKYTLKNKIDVMVVTNGSQSNKVPQLQGISLLKVSLDGPEYIHDKIRGAGAYDKAITTICCAKQYGIPVGINCTLNSYNIGHINEILMIAKIYDIKVKFQTINKELSRGKDISGLLPNINDYRGAILSLIKQDNPFIINSKSALRYLFDWPNAGKLNCSAWRFKCHIIPNGDMFTCNILVAQQKTSSINCVKDGFKVSFLKLKPTKCNGCWCTQTLELNKLFSFDLSALDNILKVYK